MDMQNGKEIVTQIDHIIDDVTEDIRSIRRYLHAHPEPSGAEYKTTSFLAEKMDTHGIHHRLAPSGRGLICDSHPPGADISRVALRADIDALRLQDEKTVIYHSVEQNLMHACGHDAHTAMLLGAVFTFNKMKEHLPPSFAWRAVFQPAEETTNGALEMIDAGALDNVSSIIALHVDPQLFTGKIGVRVGVLTAICEEFDIKVTGKGGHGARPHQAIDPISAASQFVNTVYAAIPRQVDSRSPAVVSFCVFQSGINPNVVPESAFLRGTIRTIESETSESIKARMQEIGKGVGLATGASIEIDFPYHLDSVVNDESVTGHCQLAASQLVGPRNIVLLDKPSMGGEDFAHYLKHVPGCMLRLGTGKPGTPQRYLHSPQFDINESALPIGSKLLARSAFQLWKSAVDSEAPAWSV